MRSSEPPQWRSRTGATPMGRIASVAEMAELLGPAPIEIKAPADRRHPFKEYTYEELTNAPKKV
jgi:hypothetical protein